MLEQAVRIAVKRLTGAFALGILSAAEPDKIIGARPVVIGVGEGESFIAPDIPGILHHTRNVIFWPMAIWPSSPATASSLPT